MFREKQAPTARAPPKSTTPWQGRTLGEDEEEEDLADSGRLFVRNLSYTSSEEDLEKLFSAYGGCCLHLVLGDICVISYRLSVETRQSAPLLRVPQHPYYVNRSLHFLRIWSRRESGVSLGLSTLLSHPS